MADFAAVAFDQDAFQSGPKTFVPWTAFNHSANNLDSAEFRSGPRILASWTAFNHSAENRNHAEFMSVPGVPPVVVVGETAQVSVSADVGNLTVFWITGVTAQVSVWAPVSLLSLVGETAQISVSAPVGVVSAGPISIVGETAQVSASAPVGTVSITTPAAGSLSVRSEVHASGYGATLVIPGTTEVGDLLLLAMGTYGTNDPEVIYEVGTFDQIVSQSTDSGGYAEYFKMWSKTVEVADIGATITPDIYYSDSGGSILLVVSSGALNGVISASAGNNVITTGALNTTVPSETWAVAFGSLVNGATAVTFTDPSGFTRESIASSTWDGSTSIGAWFREDSYNSGVQLPSVSITANVGGSHSGALIGVLSTLAASVTVVGVTAQVSVSNADGSITGSAYWHIAGATALVDICASSFLLLLAGISAQVDILAPGGRVGSLTATRITIQGDVVPIPTTTGSLPSVTGLANGTPCVLLPVGALSVVSSDSWVAVNGGQHTPTSGADTYGALGAVVADDDYVYAKTSTGWKRSPITTWS